nr:MAG TPA: hypothetical protein [Caudoviricetes sp.]
MSNNRASKGSDYDFFVINVRKPTVETTLRKLKTMKATCYCPSSIYDGLQKNRHFITLNNWHYLKLDYNHV